MQVWYVRLLLTYFYIEEIMSSNQTTASGDNLTLLCRNGGGFITRHQADTWLRQRQAAQASLRPTVRRAS